MVAPAANNLSFLPFPPFRRLITRLIAIVPAIIVIVIYGEAGTGPLLMLSQVIPIAADSRLVRRKSEAGYRSTCVLCGCLSHFE